MRGQTRRHWFGARQGADANSEPAQRFRSVALASAFLVGMLVHAAASATEPVCPVPRTQHELIGTTCPKVGRIGNVRVAVPQHYLLGPFTYKGVDVWDPKSFENRPRTATLDSAIEHFAVRVRVADFLPVRTSKDREEYSQAAGGRDLRRPRWIHIGFETYDPQRGTKRGELDNWLKDRITGWGPYERAAQSSWGLDHYVSVHRPSVQVVQRELFYDPRTEDTFIVCKTQKQATPPHEPFTSCRHSFLLRDLKIRVSVDNIWNKLDLRDWRLIERHTRELIEAFIVH